MEEKASNKTMEPTPALAKTSFSTGRLILTEHMDRLCRAESEAILEVTLRDRRAPVLLCSQSSIQLPHGVRVMEECLISFPGSFGGIFSGDIWGKNEYFIRYSGNNRRF